MLRTSVTVVRRSLFALLAAAAAAACDKDSTSLEPSDTPESVALTDSLAATDPGTAADTAASDSTAATLAPDFAISTSGVPYGPIGSEWAGITAYSWGSLPFNSGQDNTYANTLLYRISTARQKRMRIVVALTGGPASDFKTNGKFDLSKWKRRMDSYRNSTLKNAVAKAVYDGVLIGNTMIDEPETPKWGGNITKGMIDQMAAYSKGIFPTLPVGINQGPPGYKWRTGERYYKLDYVLYQYAYPITKGNAAAWRDAVLSRARTDGVRAAFSLNILDGGVPDYSGTWDCGGTGGKGTYTHRCRMTATQVKNYGRTIGPSGCFMAMWRYDKAFMSKTANIDAFRSIASLLSSSSRKSCRRP